VARASENAMKTSRMIRILPILAIAVAALAAPASAQDALRVRDELDRTDLRIDRAQQLLAQRPVASVQPLVNNAVTIQSQARASFGAGLYAAALRQTLLARGYADRAIANLLGLPDPDRVRAQLERTREIIDRARERIADCGIERARVLLQVADAMQRRAEDAAAAERDLAALQLTMSARERAVRAMRLCNLEEDVRDGADRALRRTDEILVRAQDAVNAHGDERARDTLARAESLQAEARREFSAERYDSSLRLTQSARSFAFRAIRQSGGSL